MQYKITKPPADKISVNLPESKSISHRAMILAALDEKECEIKNILDAEDTKITRDALRILGAEISGDFSAMKFISAIGGGGGNIFLGNSGSSMRFLLPLGPFGGMPSRYYGKSRLHDRPIGELLSAMKTLGAEFESDNEKLPVTVFPSELAGGGVKFRRLPSSQVISGLMMAASKMKNDLEIILPETVPSLPYIKMTFDLMKKLGAELDWRGNVISISNKGLPEGFSFAVEKDMSAASYWVVFALINRIPVELLGVDSPTLQGDEYIFTVAEMAGGKVKKTNSGVEISGGITKSFSVDCGDTPDLVPAIAVLAMFAPDTCEIYNIEHLRVKESDRIAAIQKNIKMLGGLSEYDGIKLSVYPQNQYTPGLIDSFDDHRIAMSFAAAATRIPNVLIDNPMCVGKSYPRFWNDFSFWRLKE